MNRFEHFLIQVLKQLAFLLIISISVLLMVNVIMRYVLHSPLAWVGEACQLLMIWLSFLGAAVVAAERRHMGMELLLHKLKGTVKIVTESFISFVIMLCLGIVIYYGTDMAIYNLGLKSESLRISYAFFYMAIPVGCFCYLLFEIMHFLRIFRPKPDSFEGSRIE